MLTKTKLRALVPGQWAQVVVPDYDCWKEPLCQATPGDIVHICLMPTYEPRWDYPNCWEWNYRVAFRHADRAYVYKERKDGCTIGPWYFGLINASLSGPNWDHDTMREHFEGKGKWLYEPASADPELCPGGDWSRYECDSCKKFVTPFSNDQGDIVCPYCDVHGLVILDEAQLDRLEQTREFAREHGLSEQLERQLGYLAGYAHHGEPRCQCVLSYDFAPHSFSFAHYVLPKFSANGQRSFWHNGGLIFQGPRHAADGSFPSLTVSLAEGTGWFCHT
jgi:hypothetical protein